MKAIHSEDGRDVLFMEIEVHEGYIDFFILKPRSWNSDNTVHEQEDWFHGFVKWDGCTEVSSIHLCNKQEYELLYKALDAVWEQAKESIPYFDPL